MRFLWVAVLVLLTACPSRSPKSTEVDAGLADAAIEVDAGAGDAGVDAGALDASVAFAVALFVETDGGMLDPVDLVQSAATIDVAQVIQVQTSVDLRDYRVRLFDWAEQIVPSDDVATRDGGLSYRIGLLQPLRPGRTYTLVIDADLGPTMVDPNGRPLDDVRLSLSVRGEIQPEPGARVPKRKKK
jgi:hypothetical protein